MHKTEIKKETPKGEATTLADIKLTVDEHIDKSLHPEECLDHTNKQITEVCRQLFGLCKTLPPSLSCKEESLLRAKQLAVALIMSKSIEDFKIIITENSYTPNIKHETPKERFSKLKKEVELLNKSGQATTLEVNYLNYHADAGGYFYRTSIIHPGDGSAIIKDSSFPKSDKTTYSMKIDTKHPIRTKKIQAMISALRHHKLASHNLDISKLAESTKYKQKLDKIIVLR